MVTAESGMYALDDATCLLTRYTQFTCFTGTKVQILTHVSAEEPHACADAGARAAGGCACVGCACCAPCCGRQGTQLTCFTGAKGTGVTCFTGRKVKILTWHRACRAACCVSRATQFTCFTGVNVQILTHRRAPCCVLHACGVCVRRL